MIKIYRYLLISLVIGLLLVGCSQENPSDGQNEQTASPTVGQQAVVPTNTPAPPVLILLASPESDPAALSNLQAQMEQIANQQGMVFEHRQILEVETAPENLRLVVAIPPASNLSGLAAGLPGSKFVALNIPGVSGTGNLIAVGGGQPSDFQAFLAGYIAAVQSDDWRVGLIYFGDEIGRNYKNAFLSGAVYFCGFCNPYYPPYYEYPVSYEVPPGAGAEILQQAADNLISQGVNTVHLAPGVETDNLYNYLVSDGMRFVGTAAPPAGLEGNWIASVIAGGELDITQVITGVLNGQTEFQSASSVQISFTGLSEARLTHYLEILAALESGEIDPQGGVIE